MTDYARRYDPWLDNKPDLPTVEGTPEYWIERAMDFDDAAALASIGRAALMGDAAKERSAKISGYIREAVECRRKARQLMADREADVSARLAAQRATQPSGGVTDVGNRAANGAR